MPTTTRGSFNETEYPDTRVPRAIFPDISGDYELNNAVVMLNLGNYDSDRNYAAIVRIHQLDSYVLFYRPVGGTWTVRNMRPLKKTLDDSLYMLDSNKSIHRLIEKVTGISRKDSLRRTRRNRRRRRSRTMRARRRPRRRRRRRRTNASPS